MGQEISVAISSAMLSFRVKIREVLRELAMRVIEMMFLLLPINLSPVLMRASLKNPMQQNLSQS